MAQFGMRGSGPGHAASLSLGYHCSYWSNIMLMNMVIIMSQTLSLH